MDSPEETDGAGSEDDYVDEPSNKKSRLGKVSFTSVIIQVKNNINIYFVNTADSTAAFRI